MTSVSDIVAIVALGVSLAVVAAQIIKIQTNRKQMRNDVNDLLKEMDLILNDIDLDDKDALYDIDMSLRGYYEKHGSKIEGLVDQLHKSRTLFYRKDKSSRSHGEFLEWLMTKFYESNQEEEERIRVWSKNIPRYRELKKNLGPRHW